VPGLGGAPAGNPPIHDGMSATGLLPLVAHPAIRLAMANRRMRLGFIIAPGGWPGARRFPDDMHRAMPLPVTPGMAIQAYEWARDFRLIQINAGPRTRSTINPWRGPTGRLHCPLPRRWPGRSARSASCCSRCRQYRRDDAKICSRYPCFCGARPVCRDRRQRLANRAIRGADVKHGTGRLGLQSVGTLLVAAELRSSLWVLSSISI
jgi:hypothetical protein